MIELGELRETDRYTEETFRVTVQRSHPQSDSLCAVEKGESLGEGKHKDGAKGNNPIVGTLLSGDVMVPSYTEYTPLEEGTPVIRNIQVIVMGRVTRCPNLIGTVPILGSFPYIGSYYLMPPVPIFTLAVWSP